MKQKLFSQIGIVVLALLMVFSFAACGGGGDGGGSDEPAADPGSDAQTPPTDPITISYASNDAPGSLRYDLLEQKFADLMAEKTGGRITVEIYPSGSLSKPGECLDAIKNGTVDSGMDSYTRYAGQYPYFELLTAPGWRFDTFEDFNAAANEYIQEFPDATTENYKVIVMCDAGQFGLVSTKPLRTIADIKGMSIRNTPQFIPLFDKLGASSVDVSSGEMYEALRLNTIDAVNTNNHAIPVFHLDEVCKSFTAIPIEHTDFTMFMSQKLYDSFDDELKAQVDEVCEAMKQVALDYLNATTQDANDTVKEANPDFEFIDLSDADVASLAEASQSLLESKAKALDDAGLKGADALAWLQSHQSK
ncbi:MAG: TRAP transporter substrate-binding protein DctP [Clostridiales Family XIII bacterium]|jgi:TRAP-type C4-dicarboxylate transport system substrate-binding protein|nr:TRAP transporter substrate-binding protein DctP [Clostridiales Family XIII bacterium]